MASINFPSNPTLNQTYTQDSTTWKWNGIAWILQPNTSPSFTSISLSSNLTVSGNASVAGTLTLTGGVSGLVLDALDNVVVPTPTDGDLLSYNSAQQRWVNVPAAVGGVVTPGGTTGSIQFNENGTFAGSTEILFNATTHVLTVPEISSTGNFTTSGVISTLNTSAGALDVAGGAMVAGELMVDGATSTFTAVTASTDSSTGALVVAGGVGIAGDINVDGNATVATPTETSHATTKSYVDNRVTAFSIAFGV